MIIEETAENKIFNILTNTLWLSKIIIIKFYNENENPNKLYNNAFNSYLLQSIRFVYIVIQQFWNMC